MEAFRNPASLAGRFLLALIFVVSGFGKLTNMTVTAGYIEHAGMPHALIYPALVASIIVELGLGILVMIGFRVRIAALLMFLWFIPVTLMFHVLPWRDALAHGDRMGAMAQQINYMKNVSIMGGLLLLAALGPGGWSIDGAGR